MKGLSEILSRIKSWWSLRCEKKDWWEQMAVKTSISELSLAELTLKVQIEEVTRLKKQLKYLRHLTRKKRRISYIC